MPNPPKPNMNKTLTGTASSATNNRTTRLVGPVERLGQRSGPTPDAELHRSNVNISWAGTRRGHFYERASSRQSRTKEALKRNSAISRDVAVPLGGNRSGSGSKRKRTDHIFQAEDMDTMVAQKGRERSMKIGLVNAQRQSSLQKARNTRRAPQTAAVPAAKRPTATSKRVQPIASHRKQVDKVATTIKSTKARREAKVGGKDLNKAAKIQKENSVPRRRR